MTESVSWRDVRDAVRESQETILEAISELKAEKDKVHGDHEERLRKVERDTHSVTVLTRAVLAALGAVVAVLTIAKLVGVL